jgi:hypothetical protein
MKHSISFSIVLLVGFLSAGCVEQSSKYRELQAQLDSVQTASIQRDTEFEEVFAVLNEIEKGLQTIRETERMLTIQSVVGGEISAKAREQMKNDMSFVIATLENYKNQIATLEKEKRSQSAEFQKRLNSLRTELEAKTQLIEDLSYQLAERDRLLRVQSEQIVSLDQSIAGLKDDLNSLQQESARKEDKIEAQDYTIYSAYYILGEKAELIAANVMSKGGLFRAAKISYQAEQAAFTRIDIREVSQIPLHGKRAKVLSVHPAGTYTLEADDNGLLTLHISRPEAFWQQTKYLVIKLN